MSVRIRWVVRVWNLMCVREEMERLPYKGGLLYLLTGSIKGYWSCWELSKGHDGIIRQNTSWGLANFFQFFFGGGGFLLKSRTPCIEKRMVCNYR